MVGQCAGFRSFSGKNGQTWFVYGFLVPFTDGDRQRGYCEGLAVKEFWSSQNLGVKAGNPYDLYFEPNQNGQARLVQCVERGESK